MGDDNPQMSQQIMLAVGARGLTVTVPNAVQLLPVAQPVEAGEALGVDAQQHLVREALDKPASGPPLKELAKGHRRAAILAGDLSLPAPYDIALSPVINALLAAEIRPSRICILAWPGAGGPLLGSAAIHRYGEEIAGEYELRAWQGTGQPDPSYAAADLRVALLPALPWQAAGSLKVEFGIALGLGRKLRMDIVSAHTGPELAAGKLEPETGNMKPGAAAVLLSGGGADWETTLEEALLSLQIHKAAAPGEPPLVRKQSVVLAFAGEEGLGSARFTGELWNLLQQAEEVLAAGHALHVPGQAAGAFDPALTVARAMSVFEQLILLSPGLAQHEEGEELAERLAELPACGQRIRLCARQEEMWELLARALGAGYRLAVEPLGWRYF